MNKEDFLNQVEALGEKWGTPQKSFIKTADKRWDIDLHKNGLKEEVDKLESKSFPINEIFLKPALIGKSYLIYNFKYYKMPNKSRKIIRLIGLLQSSEIDFNNFKYCYFVADDTSNITISRGRANVANNSSVVARYKRYPVVTEEYREKNNINFLNDVFRGKIWKGCYALDLSYLIGNSGSVFMNWDSNPLEGEK